MTLSLNDPLQIGSLQLRNRLVMAPMQQYRGTPEAFANDHHVAFYGSRAAHVGLVILESTAVSPEGRLIPNDIGIYTDRHVEPLRRIADAVHARGALAFVQLSHGGRKASPETTKRLLAPSAIAYDESFGTPAAMSRSDLERTLEEFRLAAARSVRAGFDGVEIHAAHGFLLHQFLSPLSNKRTDEYGGSPENRARLLKEVLAAVRAETGPDYPIMIRVSATDFAPGGLTPAELARMLKPLENGFDALDVSAGGLLPAGPKAVHAGYQAPHAAVFKQHLSVPVIAVGLIRTRGHADGLLEDGLADAVAIARPLLEDADYAARLLAPEAQAAGSARGA